MRTLIVDDIKLSTHININRNFDVRTDNDMVSATSKITHNGGHIGKGVTTAKCLDPDQRTPFIIKTAILNDIKLINLTIGNIAITRPAADIQVECTSNVRIPG